MQATPNPSPNRPSIPTAAALAQVQRPEASSKAAPAQLFEDELNRATGTDRSTGEGHRTERETARTRHAAQAAKADEAQGQRESARSAREQSATQRQQGRAERLERSEGARQVPTDTQKAATPAPRPAERAPAAPEATAQPAAQPTADRAPAEPAPKSPPAPQAAPSAATPAPLATTGLANTASSTATTSLANAPNSPVSTQNGSQTSQNGPQTGSNGAKGLATNQPQPTAEKAPAPFRDLVSEMMVAREDDLDRQASILRQVRAQLAPGNREITLQLSPASLGQIQMRLSLIAGRLTAVLRAASPETLEDLRHQLPELTASLEAQGFEVADFDLDLIS